MKKLLFLFMTLALACYDVQAQTELVAAKMNRVKHPITGKWGYAFKEQNINSPLHGITSTTVNVLGKVGSELISKSDADWIDWVVPPHYDNVSKSFNENLSMVELNGKVGFIDVYNRFVIQPSFDGGIDLDGFCHGLAAVALNGKWGFIDKEGAWVVKPVYENADNFNDYYVAAVKKDGKWGVIDMRGDIKLPCDNKVKAAMMTVPVSNKRYRDVAQAVKKSVEAGQYRDVQKKLDATSDRVNKSIANAKRKQPLVYKTTEQSGLFGVKDNFDRWIVPPIYKTIKEDKDDKAFLVKNDSVWGCYLWNGSRLITPCFDSMTEFSGGKSTVIVEDVKGWITIDGELKKEFLQDLCNKGIEVEKTNKSRAYGIYERALLVNPEYASALNNLALIDLGRKDYNKGIRKLKQAVELDPNNETISKNLAMAKDARKERRNARWSTGLSIASAVITLGSTIYSTYSAIDGGGGYASTGSSSAGGTSFSDVSGGGGGGSRTCLYCKGNGICKFCNGSGQGPRTITGTNKHENCHYCHGKKTCHNCRGKGVVGGGSSSASGKTSGSVSGSCKDCHGSGVCAECNGTGVRYVAGQPSECWSCHGNRKCTSCKGGVR